MPYDWRLNPYQCIECETRQQACRCCDNGQDSIPFVVVIDGCGAFAGRYEFDAVRYKSPTALPSGMSYPASNPCGVFIGTISAGDGCTAGGVAWTGELKLMSWCDGTDAEIPWHVEIYCYNDDANQWESQGEATVTSYECLCSGPRFAFTLPELDCCCDGGGEPIETCCCPDDPIPRTVTATLTNLSGCPCLDGATFTLQWVSGETWSGTITVCGVSVTLAMTCTNTDPCEMIARLTVNGDLTADVLAQIAPTCSAGTAAGQFESFSDIGGWAAYCGSDPWAVSIEVSW